MKSKRKKTAIDPAEFLIHTFLRLVSRGFARERDIPDSILRRVWRIGKQLHNERMARETKNNPPEPGKHQWHDRDR